MNFIQYNPKADLGWIMGDTLAKAGGLLYQNYLDRGEAKNLDNEMATEKANQLGGFSNQLGQLSQLKGEDFRNGVSQLYANGYQGPLVTEKNVGDIGKGLLEQSNYMKGLAERNKYKRLHDEGYQTYDQAIGAMPQINSFLNLGK